MSTFTYNGTTSSTYGIFVEHRPVVTFPKRVIESINVPGRSGNLLFDTGAYDNVTLTYQVAYIHSGSVRADAISIATWLYQHDYYELSDTYDPSYFRKAVYVSPLNVTDILNVAGRANITFDCKPQRYLTSGKTELSPAKNSSITNNYEPALPVLTIACNGNGTVTIGGTTITITGNSGNLVIDSERQTAENGGNNANSLISLSNGFPVLEHGSTTVTWTGSVTSVKVVPNWWTL